MVKYIRWWGVLLSMETTVYQLKTDSNRKLAVPAEFAVGAEELIKLVLDDPGSLVGARMEHPYLANLDILTAAVKLAVVGADSPQSARLQDEVYLQVCRYGTSLKMKGSEREEAMALDWDIAQTIKHLR